MSKQLNYRIQLVSWESYSAWFRASTPEEARQKAKDLFYEDGNNHFKFMSGDIEEVTVIDRSKEEL